MWKTGAGGKYARQTGAGKNIRGKLVHAANKRQLAIVHDKLSQLTQKRRKLADKMTQEANTSGKRNKVEMYVANSRR